MSVSRIRVVVAVAGFVGLVAAACAPLRFLLPVISGGTSVGDTLTVTVGGWLGDPESYVFGWESCDSPSGGCVGVGADEASYVTAEGDEGRFIRAVVTASNAAGASSVAAAAVGPIGPGAATGQLEVEVVQAEVVVPADPSSARSSAVVAPSPPAVVQTPACPSGTVLAGGGFALAATAGGDKPAGVVIEDSQPKDGGWYAVAVERPGTPAGWRLGAHAVCLRATPATTDLDVQILTQQTDVAADPGADVATAQTASCPTGYAAAGGGFDLGRGTQSNIPEGVTIEDSQPKDGGWYAVALERPAVPEDWYVRAWVVCLGATNGATVGATNVTVLTDIAADDGTSADSAIATSSCSGATPGGGGFDMGAGTQSNIAQGVTIEDSGRSENGWFSKAREAPAVASQWYVRSWQTCLSLNGWHVPVDGPPLVPGTCYNELGGFSLIPIPGGILYYRGPLDTLNNAKLADNSCPILWLQWPDFTVVDAHTSGQAATKCASAGLPRIRTAASRTLRRRHAHRHLDLLTRPAELWLDDSGVKAGATPIGGQRCVGPGRQDHGGRRTRSDLPLH